MIKLSGEGTSKATLDWKLGFLHQTVNQVMNAKEKLVEEIRSVTPVNKWMQESDTVLLLIWRMFHWSGGKVKPLTTFSSAKA